MSARRADRARRKAFAPFFFGKQTVLFAVVCVGIIVLDLFLYIGIAIYDSNLNFGNGSPHSVTSYVGDNLALQDDGSYAVPEDALAWMDSEQCWALLISNTGEPAWNYKAPEEVVHSYALADVAVFSRMGYLNDYPCFVWQRDDGLLVTGFPKDSYVMSAVNYLPQQSLVNWPIYALLIFLADASVLFLAYSVSKRRVVKSTAPMIEALDALAREEPVFIQLKGSLRDVGESINAAGAVMRRKDEARKRWVTGVSHDIRTPLAISLGHAERIACDESVDERTREKARVIVRQNERIRDLVADLNIASKLEYDMQPADLRACRPARLVRSVAADCANAHSDERFAFEVDVDEGAEDLETLLDERLVDRALRNLTNNAIRHNDGGCTICLSACVEGAQVRIGVRDDGAGISRQAVARLNEEAEALVRLKPSDEDFFASGPLPPPHFAEYRPEKAREINERLSLRELGAHAVDATEKPYDAATDEMPDRADDAPSLAPKDLVGINEHGLGLSLVARIAAAHGGHAEFDGDENEGFSAVMVLPIERVERSEA
ncbi:MAG: HAMP domain-containing sensor histidine kinase [Slackia sp.]|nr:HAMP domain-containing sensor histidine kinase [Slackia sp.]